MQDTGSLGFTRSQELELASHVYYLPLSFASRTTAGKRRRVRDRRLDLGWKVWGLTAGIAAWLRRHILVPRSLHPWKLPKIPDQGPGKGPLTSSAPHQGWHPLVGESRPPSIHPLQGPTCPPIPHHSAFPPKFGCYHFIYIFIKHYHVSSISKYLGGEGLCIIYIFANNLVQFQPAPLQNPRAR